MKQGTRTDIKSDDLPPIGAKLEIPQVSQAQAAKIANMSEGRPETRPIGLSNPISQPEAAAMMNVGQGSGRTIRY